MDVKTISGVCVLNNNRLLLLKQSENEKDGNPGGWGPPAGHGEENESLIDTAIRETKEEAGFVVQPDTIVSSGLYRASDGNNYLIVLYKCKFDNSEIQIDHNEISDYKWVSLDELQNDMYKLRHPLLKPLLMKAITDDGFPLSQFVDRKIQV